MQLPYAHSRQICQTTQSRTCCVKGNHAIGITQQNYDNGTTVSIRQPPQSTLLFLRESRLHIHLDRINQLGTRLCEINRSRARDRVPHPSLVVEGVHLGTTVEEVHSVSCTVKSGGVFGFAVFAKLVKLASRHADEFSCIFVEA